MDAHFLEDLLKKDEDAVVLTSTTFKTTANLGEEIPPDEDLTVIPHVKVNIQIVRHLFVVHGMLSYLVSIFGIVPFYLLLSVPYVSLVLLWASLGASIPLYWMLYWFRASPRWAVPACILWALNGFVIICTLASVLRSMAPLQGTLIFFVESVAVILLGYAFTAEIDCWWAALVMASTGLAVWGLGLYAFVVEQDWITSGVLFGVCVVLYPAYASYQIHRIHRYHLKELTTAVVQFFTDPIGVPIAWISARCATSRRDPLSAHAASTSFALQTVLEQETT